MNFSAITRLARAGVAPAIGCTEPICVALCAARAAQLHRQTFQTDVNAQLQAPERVEVRLSANIVKNAMGVGIPGTGMVGLPIAVALGCLVGRPECGLEVLRDVQPQDVSAARRWIDEGRIHIVLEPAAPDLLFVDCRYTSHGHTSRAVIQHAHTNFVQETADFHPIPDEPCCPAPEPLLHDLKETPAAEECIKTPATTSETPAASEEEALNLKKVWDYATQAPLTEISFIDEAAHLNMAAAEYALRDNYGHRLGKALSRPLGRGIMGDSIFSHILSATAAACDARMAGAQIPVMSNSGSGNQGICATNPVCVFARENHNTAEETTRALMLSHLTAIYIKQSLGPLSALCGCVVASTGAAVGITYLMGGAYPQAAAAVKNMVANLTGMICDGAKPACALKLTSGVSTAVLSAMLAMQGECVTSAEGIVDEDVDRCIRNLTHLGKDAMQDVDRCVLDIMVRK